MGAFSGSSIDAAHRRGQKAGLEAGYERGRKAAFAEIESARLETAARAVVDTYRGDGGPEGMRASMRRAVDALAAALGDRPPLEGIQNPHGEVENDG